jgi:hypothetical protein
LAGLLYGTVAAVSITARLPHYELLILGLQILFLLPALVYALYFPHASESERYAWKESNGLWRHSPGMWICLLGFVLCALIVSYRVSQAVTIADEGSYRFQAQIFDGLRTVADAPPIAPTSAGRAPLPLAYEHFVLFHSGWFSKYPIGWPAVLALPEKLGLSWAANPVLGAILLILTGKIAREAFGAATMLPALWITALSPYCLGQSVGLLSHALCAVLIAAACWFWLRGIRRQSLTQFSLAFAMLVLSFHVRPFTAFIAAAVFGAATLWYCRRDRLLLRRAGMVAAGFAVLAVVSVLLYNRAYTGSPWTSPYNLYDGRMTNDITLSPHMFLRNLFWTRRFSAQSTLLYAFPFVFALAAYGFWVERRSPAARVLACLFPALFIGYSAWIFSSDSLVGERYYFEAYFSVAVLAARGLQALLLKWRSSNRVVVLAAVVITGIQAVMTVVAVRQVAAAGQPYRDVSKVAEQFQNCRCAVFLKRNSDSFINNHLNLNTPAWKSARVFYLLDPGPGQRQRWANVFGWNRWAVIGYDAQDKKARLDLYHSSQESKSSPARH